jgi:hypothetical protein
MNDLNDLLETILNFLKDYGFWPSVVLGILYSAFYVARNPEVIDKWSFLYYKYIGILEKRRKRKIVSSELSFRITKAAKEFNKESDGILPFGVRIKWLNDTESQVSVQNEEVILVLKESENCDKNIVDALMLFTPKALLPKARNSCDPKILHSIDVFTIKKMLGSGKYTSAYNYFLSNIIESKIACDEISRDDLDTLQLSDEKGFYSRILLEEFRLLGESIYNTYEEDKFIEETQLFFKFVKDLVRREKGDDKTPLLFVEGKIKIGILFVAKFETIKKYGIEAYIIRIKKDFDAGAERVYVMGHSIFEEEYELGTEGQILKIRGNHSFKYLDEIERKLEKDNNYTVKLSDKFEVRINKNKKMSKLLLVEKG